MKERGKMCEGERRRIKLHVRERESKTEREGETEG